MTSSFVARHPVKLRGRLKVVLHLLLKIGAFGEFMRDALAIHKPCPLCAANVEPHGRSGDSRRDSRRSIVE